MVTWMVFGIAASLGLATSEKSIPLFNFEVGTAAESWKGHQGAALRVESDAEAGDTAKGHVLVVDFPKSGIASSNAKTVPADWSAAERLRFRARRVKGSEPVTLEVWAVEADKKTKFWRKFTVESAEWQQFDFPIRFMRWGDGRIPNPAVLDRIAFYARDPGSIAFDDIALCDESTGPGATIPITELAKMAFADQAKARIVSRKLVEIATDSSELDLEQLANRLEPVVRSVANECGFTITADRRPQLLVFAEDAAYRSFPTTLAATMDSNASRPTADGYTIFGVATSSFDPAQGAARPVYVHEIVHSALSKGAWIDNRNDWFQEGLATWLQIHLHHQEDFDVTVMRGIDDEKRREPLEKLLNGERIALNRYWQAATVVDYLLRGSGKFKPVVAALSESGSTAIAPILEPVLSKDLATFEAEWMKWCREQYAK